MSRLTRLISAACSAVLIAACGGGGGGSTTAADPIDKYLGSWVTACVTDFQTFFGERSRFTASKIDAIRANFKFDEPHFERADCTGREILGLRDNEILKGTVVIDGPTTVPTPGVDEITFENRTLTVIFVDPNFGLIAFVTETLLPPKKDIAFVNGNQLQFGNSLPTDPVDPQGYPTTLNTSETFIKQ